VSQILASMNDSQESGVGKLQVDNTVIDKVADTLVKAAYHYGSYDNITVILKWLKKT
jgi:serine/threonine protein phosphatase PrpC